MKLFQQKTEFGTINLYQTTKFKTVRIRITFRSCLSKHNVTTRGLLPYIMQAVNNEYQTRDTFQARLEELYGMSFDAVATTIGLTHNITFDMHIVDPQVVKEKNLLVDAIDILNKVIFHPHFDEKILLEEKRKIKEYFFAIDSDKLRYSFKRIKEAIFQNQTYRFHPLGDIDDLENISIKSLQNEYHKMIINDRIDISIVGNVSQTFIINYLLTKLPFKERNYALTIIDKTKPIAYEKNIIEKQKVNQTKLVCAFSIPIYLDDNEYYAASLLNTILGGNSESILFSRLRNELGKVYFISSNYDATKGVFYIYAGINKSDIDLVITEINKAITTLKNAVSIDVINLAKKIQIQSLIESMDSTGSILSRLSLVELLNRDFDITKAIEKINNITQKQILSVANKIEKLACFILAGESDE